MSITGTWFIRYPSGSMIFYNILMIMGVASVITGIAVVPGMFTDYLVMIGFAVVLIAFLRSGIIPRPAGIGLAIAYAVYLGYTLLL